MSHGLDPPVWDVLRTAGCGTGVDSGLRAGLPELVGPGDGIVPAGTAPRPARSHPRGGFPGIRRNSLPVAAASPFTRPNHRGRGEARFLPDTAGDNTAPARAAGSAGGRA